MLEHLPGYEIPTKHKEAMRQFHKFAKIGLQQLVRYYDLERALCGASFNTISQNEPDLQELAGRESP
jgi:hypothetical protein